MQEISKQYIRKLLGEILKPSRKYFPSTEKIEEFISLLPPEAKGELEEVKSQLLEVEEAARRLLAKFGWISDVRIHFIIRHLLSYMALMQLLACHEFLEKWVERIKEKLPKPLRDYCRTLTAAADLRFYLLQKT